MDRRLECHVACALLQCTVYNRIHRAAYNGASHVGREFIFRVRVLYVYSTHTIYYKSNRSLARVFF